MSSEEITYEFIKREQLADFVESERFRKLRNLPIHPRRARSQVRNPRAEAGDVLLTLAWRGEALAGYLGTLPDLIFDDEGQPARTAWMSCIWTDPNLRGRGLGKGLVRKAWEAWDGRLCITEFTAPAQALYEKLGLFDPVRVQPGLRLYYRMTLAYWLPPKRDLFRKGKSLLQLTDAAANLLLQPWFFFSRKELLPAGTKLEYPDRLSPEMQAFIEKHHRSDLGRRSTEDLEWILHHPWLVEAPVPDEAGSRYAFSSSSTSLGQHLLALRDKDGALSAILLLLQRNGHLKLTYCFAPEEAFPDIAHLLRQWMLHSRLHTLTIFHRGLADFLGGRSTGALFAKKIRRGLFITPALSEGRAFSAHRMQGGIGDAAFT